MKCWLCSVAITPENDSREHIIPQALGGRKTVNGFICKRCNNETGAEWDSDLMKFLELISIFVNPSREDGKRTPAISASGDDGLEYLIHPLSDGRPLIPTIKHPRVIETPAGEDRIIIEGTFGTEAEARNALQKIKERKYHDIDVDKEIANARRNQSRPTLTNTIVWNVNCRKSVVKTALALAYRNGILRESCEYATNFLSRKYSLAAEAVFPSDEQILTTPEDWHSIFIMQVEERLVAYVSYYNVMRFLVILSLEYIGEFVAMSYAVDPISGMEIHKQNFIEVFGLGDFEL